MKNLIPLVILLTMVSCSQEPPRLVYGKDVCDLCKMTMMDSKFGAALINKHGKMYRFDSIECMVNYLQENTELKAEKYLVTDFSDPGELIDAGQAFFLYGGDVVSPMGGELVAFKSKEEAEKVNVELNAELLRWEDVKELQLQ